MSVNSTSPATLFGGEWEQIKDTFLLACGSTYSSDGAVSTAQHGNADAVVVSHRHTPNNNDYKYIEMKRGAWLAGGDKRLASTSSSGVYYIHGGNENNNALSYQNGTSYSGTDGTGKNMPPYMAVFVWRRTKLA